MRRALICGIGGQDGSYLAALLLDKGYEVWGTSRDAETATFSNLQRLGLVGRVKLLSMAPNDFRSVFIAVEHSEPDEIYYLSGQSSVGLSFGQPTETLESIVSGVLNMLEVMRLRGREMRLYNAGSSECFGDTGDRVADEDTPFRPRSPYAVAKASAHWLVANYREAYGLHCCTGILFNHESPLRPPRFVTRKIVSGAARIAAGRRERLVLGNLSIARDWGWAPEYVDAMWRMLAAETPEDFVVATGQTAWLEDFVAEAFAYHGLDWRDHVEISAEFARPSDIQVSRADSTRAAERLGWRAQTHMRDVVRKMCAAEVQQNESTEK
ncbi:GDP-mannose 4,6-dehydratase [Hyphobacterium sp.]|uniref:GDP-mannose 4,6-dehydratase n=1 Tax=Hyphobacterium sp. TaxID=2004662 RepID=UPI0037496979